MSDVIENKVESTEPLLCAFIVEGSHSCITGSCTMMKKTKKRIN